MDEVTARTTALSQAVALLTHNGDVPKADEVIRTAEIFYNFLIRGGTR